jgi:hypothetical protein
MLAYSETIEATYRAFLRALQTSPIPWFYLQRAAADAAAGGDPRADRLASLVRDYTAANNTHLDVMNQMTKLFPDEWGRVQAEVMRADAEERAAQAGLTQ